MDYTLELIHSEAIVCVTVYGHLNSREAIPLGKYIRSKALELNYKIIIDFRFSINHILISDAYFWFTNHYDIVNLNFRIIPTAHITNEVNAEFFNFVQTTCQNNGIPIRLFRDLGLAKDWLSNKNYIINR